MCVARRGRRQWLTGCVRLETRRGFSVAWKRGDFRTLSWLSASSLNPFSTSIAHSPLFSPANDKYLIRSKFFFDHSLFKMISFSDNTSDSFEASRDFLFIGTTSTSIFAFEYSSTGKTCAFYRFKLAELAS